MLHELVARHAQTMLAELRDPDPEGGGLPRYVERELAAYLRCGILAHGFARVRCRPATTRSANAIRTSGRDSCEFRVVSAGFESPARTSHKAASSDEVRAIELRAGLTGGSEPSARPPKRF